MTRRRRRLPDLVRSTVALHLTSGRTIAGVLLDEYDDVVALTKARVEDGDGSMVAADGEVVVPLDRIEWCQFGVRLDDVPRAGASASVRALPARDLRGTG